MRTMLLPAVKVAEGMIVAADGRLTPVATVRVESTPLRRGVPRPVALDVVVVVTLEGGEELRERVIKVAAQRCRYAAHRWRRCPRRVPVGQGGLCAEHERGWRTSAS